MFRGKLGWHFVEGDSKYSICHWHDRIYVNFASILRCLFHKSGWKDEEYILWHHFSNTSCFPFAVESNACRFWEGKTSHKTEWSQSAEPLSETAGLHLAPSPLVTISSPLIDGTYVLIFAYYDIAYLQFFMPSESLFTYTKTVAETLSVVIHWCIC